MPETLRPSSPFRSVLLFVCLFTYRPCWAQQYVVSTIAGAVPPPTPASALSTPIAAIFGVTAASDGSLFFTSENCVFKLDSRVVLTRIAGTSTAGYSGDGGPAVKAQLQSPNGLAINAAGEIFVADAANHRIRKILADGTITTVAGNGIRGFSGDGGPAGDAELSNPSDVAWDNAGDLFIADRVNQRVREVGPNGIITTVAGNGAICNCPGPAFGDGGPALNAELFAPDAIAIDNASDLLIADAGHGLIRKVSGDGTITTVAGGGASSQDGIPATKALVSGPSALAVDGVGNLFIADGLHRVRKVTLSGTIVTVAGYGAPGFNGDGGPAINAQLADLYGVAVDQTGNVVIAGGDGRLRQVNGSGIINTIAGNGNQGFSGDGGPARAAQLLLPQGVAVDASGNIFIADTNNSRVRKISADGSITTIAGTGTPGFSGDGGPALQAQFSQPAILALDAAGNLFVADWGNYAVRRISTKGVITAVDGGPPGNSRPNTPGGLVVDAAGNLFISDLNNYRVRKISPTGAVTTIAGTGLSGFSGDGGPAISAQLGVPSGLAIDPAGILFIADRGNGRVRKVSPDGIITTVAGTGANFSGDGGPALNAGIDPVALTFDGSGNLFVMESGQRVRRISPDGIITTIAGTGMYGFSGDGGPATNALFNTLSGIAADTAGNIYLADQNNNAIRMLQPVMSSVLIGAIVDAASEGIRPVAPGKIVIIYGAGLGPTQLQVAAPGDGGFGTALGGTTVAFDGAAAPLIYTSTTQIAAIVPYEVSGATTQVAVVYQGQTSPAFPVSVEPSAPSLFTLNQTGAGPAAAINADGTVNTASHPIGIGGYVSLYATGEGQTTPPGVDGKLATQPLPQPMLPVSVTIGGIPAPVVYQGGAPGEVAGLMQVNVQVPPGVQPGGYVPVVLKVGTAASNSGVWIAVSGN